MLISEEVCEPCKIEKRHLQETLKGTTRNTEKTNKSNTSPTTTTPSKISKKTPIVTATRPQGHPEPNNTPQQPHDQNVTITVTNRCPNCKIINVNNIPGLCYICKDNSPPISTPKTPLISSNIIPPLLPNYPTIPLVSSPNIIALCWNCQKPGHAHKDCPEEKTRFCFRCGRDNFDIHSCPYCRLERRGESTPRWSRPSQRNVPIPTLMELDIQDPQTNSTTPTLMDVGVQSPQNNPTIPALMDLNIQRPIGFSPSSAQNQSNVFDRLGPRTPRPQ